MDIIKDINEGKANIVIWLITFQLYKYTDCIIHQTPLATMESGCLKLSINYAEMLFVLKVGIISIHYA